MVGIGEVGGALAALELKAGCGEIPTDAEAYEAVPEPNEACLSHLPNNIGEIVYTDTPRWRDASGHQIARDQNDVDRAGNLDGRGNAEQVRTYKVVMPMVQQCYNSAQARLDKQLDNLRGDQWQKMLVSAYGIEGPPAMAATNLDEIDAHCQTQPGIAVTGAYPNMIYGVRCESSRVLDPYFRRQLPPQYRDWISVQDALQGGVRFGIARADQVQQIRDNYLSEVASIVLKKIASGEMPPPGDETAWIEFAQSGPHGLNLTTLNVDCHVRDYLVGQQRMLADLERAGKLSTASLADAARKYNIARANAVLEAARKAKEDARLGINIVPDRIDDNKHDVAQRWTEFLKTNPIVERAKAQDVAVRANFETTLASLREFLPWYSTLF